MTSDGHRPQRWQRAGAYAGIVAAVLLVIDLATLSASPSIESSAGAVDDHLDINHTVTVVTSYVGAVIAVLLLPFVASLRAFVHDSREEAEWRWTLTLLSGSVAVAMMLVGSGIHGAAAVLADHQTEPAAVSALFAAAKIVLSFALIPIGVVVMTNAGTMSRSPGIRWLVRFGAQIGIVAWLATSVIFFTDDDWFGPGEPVVALAAFGLSLWLVATAVTILQGGAAAPSH